MRIHLASRSVLLPLIVLLVAARGSVAQSSRAVVIQNGDVTLAGTVYLPAGGGRHAAVVALHSANGGTRDFHAYRHLITSLPSAGFAVLLYDRRGTGNSTGDGSTASFRQLASDAVAAVAELKKLPEIDPHRIGVWGISQGGWLGPLAATMSPDIRFVASISGPGVTPAAQMDYAAAHHLRASGQPQRVVDRALRVRTVFNEYYRGRTALANAELAVAGIREEPWFADVMLPSGGRPSPAPRSTRWFSEMDYDPLPVLQQVRVPMAIFFAEQDAWVPVPQSLANIRRATARNHAVTFATFPDADHLMETGAPDSGGPTSTRYTAAFVQWLRVVAQMK